MWAHGEEGDDGGECHIIPPPDEAQEEDTEDQEEGTDEDGEDLQEDQGFGFFGSD